MAKDMAKRNVRGKEIAPEIRGAFLRAVKSLEYKGKSLTEIVEQQLTERPLETLKVISQFIPKEMLIEADVTTQLDEISDGALDNEIRRLASAAGVVFAAAREAEAPKH